jgi:hypothetical protein
MSKQRFNLSDVTDFGLDYLTMFKDTHAIKTHLPKTLVTGPEKLPKPVVGGGGGGSGRKSLHRAVAATIIGCRQRAVEL